MPRLQPKNLTYQFCPIQARMEQVGDHQTIIAATEHLERLGSVPRRINLESRLLKDMCSEFANAKFVVNQKDSYSGHSSRLRQLGRIASSRESVIAPRQ